MHSDCLQKCFCFSDKYKQQQHSKQQLFTTFIALFFILHIVNDFVFHLLYIHKHTVCACIVFLRNVVYLCVYEIDFYWLCSVTVCKGCHNRRICKFKALLAFHSIILELCVDGREFLLVVLHCLILLDFCVTEL